MKTNKTIILVFAISFAMCGATACSDSGSDMSSLLLLAGETADLP